MMGRRARPLLASLVTLAVAAGGMSACGSGDPVERIGGGGGNQPTLDTDPLAPLPGETTTVPAPGTAVTTPPAPATTATTTQAAPSGPTSTTGGAEAQGEDPDTSTTGGAGAESEGEAGFVIDSVGSLGPAGVPVPSTVPVTVTVRNQDDASHRVTLLIENRPERTIPAGGSASFALDPLAPGSYTMLLDGGGSAAVLQVGPDQGP